jgi:hypothetical protein
MPDAAVFGSELRWISADPFASRQAGQNVADGSVADMEFGNIPPDILIGGITEQVELGAIST